MAVRSLRAADRHFVLRTALAIGALVVHATTAHADDIEAARRDFAEGVRLLEDGDYEAARQRFLRADAAHHAPAIVYDIAVAEEHLSHPQAAVDAYEAYVAEAGDQGELASAARTAIVQIKARSTRLRITTEPPGAKITVDGFALATPSPASFLVPGGRHTIVASTAAWRGEANVDATGSGDTYAVAILPAPAAPIAVLPAVPPPALPPARPTGPDGFVWGAAFALTPYHLFGASSGRNRRDATQIMTGIVLEAGGALSDRVAILARGMLGIGPEAKPKEGAPFTYAYMGGPGISVRLGSRVLAGATFVAGRIETVAHDAPYGTDLVFGGMVDVGIVVVSTTSGEYVLAAQPGALLASSADNTTLFVPVTFGYRAF